MNRQQRTQLAGETLTILERGSYTAPSGHVISIRDELSTACAQTRLYRPNDYESLVSQVKDLPAPHQTVFHVSHGTTLEAARTLVEQYPALSCLNFASAKNPGGGFLSGSQAQEESLARASGLYATLQTQPEYYDYHRQGSSSLYSDHMIFSPGVPVFRDDAGQLLETPWATSFITAAAVNAGAVRQNEPSRIVEIVPAMERRTRMVLSVAALHQCEALVLGAWGCGVFQNDPATIAAIFARTLAEPLFHGRFRHVEFAVYDPSAQGFTLVAFQQAFVG